ncbi:hypothetical protein GQ44DRAFT_776598 [Phaeosphaeriaceae sp. PMI808]|nr:hypothetical protein GQ44DRAFT_776598 [Phaeosphaeriaceae sp. PMI808]
MTPSLDRLPFDILFYIASSLQLDDVVHLGQTCHQLKALLDERTLYRSIVEAFPHTDEARLARAGTVTYKQVHQAIYDRRDAFSNAHPFSARILGQGQTFLYRQGIICVLTGYLVHVSDVRSASASDAVELDLTTIIRPTLESNFSIFGYFKPFLMYHSDGILAVYVEVENHSNSGYLFVISTAKNLGRHSRVVRAFPIAESSKLFVRHNSQYLYYGTHTGIGDDGHHKWEISGVSLDGQHPLSALERALLFEGFHGTDIGSTVAFEIYNDHFYAVSNQGTYGVEEADWTSFYHCVMFPLNNPTMDKVEKDKCVYRRQHAQGPIHDSWTNLSLQLSERTNEVVIIESRCEWERASSQKSRTFYTSKFNVNTKPSSGVESPCNEIPKTLLLPENDLFVDRTDCMPNPKQYSWSRHPEFSADVTSPRSFILAKTKFRAYNYSCTSFLDLVEDDQCCNNPSMPPCLRIRVGSQRPKSLNVSPLNSKSRSRVDGAEPEFEDFTQYQNSPIRMWPPPASRCACSKRLHGILNPPPLASGLSPSRTVIGVLDERTLVYMVKPGRPYGASDENTLGTIVMVDFTRPWEHPHNTPSPLFECNNKLGADSADGCNASCWEWTLGQKRLCTNKMCK